MTVNYSSMAYRSKFARKGIESIDAHRFFFALVCLAYLKPAICEYLYLWDVAFNLVRFGLSIMYFGLLLFATKGRLNKKITELVLIFLLVLCNTFHFGGDVIKVAGHFVPAIGFVAFAEYYIDRLYDIIEVIYYEFGMMIILNLITILWYPNGILTEGNLGYTPVWLIGQKQSWAFCCVPFIFCGNIIRKTNIRSNLFYWCCLGCLGGSLLKATPLGLMINLAIVLSLLFFNDKFDTKISPRVLVAVVLIGALGTVFVATQYDHLFRLQSFLGNINVVGMRKDKTIRVRADMWLAGIKMFLAHPLLGVGRPSWKMVRSYGGVFYHTNLHNMIVDMFTTSGISGLILYLLYIFGDLNKIIGKYRNDIVFILVISIFGICIENITECLYSPFCFWILSLGQHVDALADFLPTNNRKRCIKITI